MKIYDFNQKWTFRKADENTEKEITIPHDAMLHEKREPNCASGSAGAYFPGGTYIYKKQWDVPQEFSEKIVIVEFEGIYRNAEIMVNGTKIGTMVYGYTTSRFDITKWLKFGAENTMEIKVDNQDVPNSRWYSGSGIYRPVWLYVLEPVHIKPYGVRIQTMSYSPARVRISVSHEGGTAKISIWDREVQIGEQEGDVAEFEIVDAKLWSDQSPYLYTCRVELNEDGYMVDSRELTFGIRMVEWGTKGLFINGQETLLRGGCVHHDNGILGACAYGEAEKRRIRILKENGFNAIRSSHNPCSRAMLEACDEYGMYVMDETWDMWYKHKSKHDYASDFMEHYRDDIQSMVEKDYNHPSVIFYSIGNEVSEPATEKGVELAKNMVEYLHELDDTRAVTAGINLMIVANAAKGKAMYSEEGGLSVDSSKGMSGMNSTMFNMITQMIGSGMNKAANGNKADLATSPVLDALDIAGYNYASGRYPMEGKKHPDRIIFGSETFPPDIAKNWSMVKKYPYLIGDFMWTAFDYIGEVGFGAWFYERDAKGFDKPYPWLLNGGGVIDILGNPDGEALYAKAVWGLSDVAKIAVTPANHPGEQVIKSAWRGTNAIPSWSWQGCEGNAVTVEVYTKAKKVRLMLNGKQIGQKKVKDYKCVFKTKYQPGILEAVGLDENGNVVEKGSLQSASGTSKICICEEKRQTAVDELLFVHVNVCDENGIVESNADDTLSIRVEGGELLGFGSANPRTEENYLDGSFTTYYGRAMAVIRVGNAESVKITVVGKRYKEAVKTITLN